MIPRRIAIGVSIVLMIAGFIAWQAISRDNILGPGEVVPGEIPEIVTGLEEVPVADQMMAYVPAVRAAELHAAMRAEHDLAHLPPPRWACWRSSATVGSSSSPANSTPAARFG